MDGVVLDNPADVKTTADALPVSKPVPVLVQRGDTKLFITLTLPATVE